MKILAGVLLVMFAVNTSASADTEMQPYLSFASENNPSQASKISQGIVFTPNNNLHLLTGKVVTDIHAFDNFIKKVKVVYYEDTEEGKREAAYKAQLTKKPSASIGMSASQVLSKTNWGKPKYKNKTTNAYGTHEQWVYDDYQYLYFDNGKLTTIQQ